MIKKTFFSLAVFSFVISAFILSPKVARAETDAEKVDRLSKEIQTYQKELEKLQSQKNSLSNQIAQYDAQIRLTTLKIAEAEQKIILLGGRISLLENSLESLANAYKNRVIKTYKVSRMNEPYMVFVSAKDLKSAVSNYHYLKKIQEADRELLVKLENTQTQYEEQKVDQEDLQKNLEEQKKALDDQKKAKAKLLEVTKNNETKYQQLLSSARAEFEAIQAIVAGKGAEEMVGKVSQGQRIASIIQGPSCNSNGEHLHFIVSENGVTHNPFNYLKSGIDYQNCSGSSCGSGDGDSFNPTGSWDWPISPKIDYSQGYGTTWAVRNTWVGKVYRAHNGIDIDSGNPEVRAVKSGTLYRGSYTGTGGCRLRYVRVHHDEANMDTFYLHINY